MATGEQSTRWDGVPANGGGHRGTVWGALPQGRHGLGAEGSVLGRPGHVGLARPAQGVPLRSQAV